MLSEKSRELCEAFEKMEEAAERLEKLRRRRAKRKRTKDAVAQAGGEITTQVTPLSQDR